MLAVCVKEALALKLSLACIRTLVELRLIDETSIQLSRTTSRRSYYPSWHSSRLHSFVLPNDRLTMNRLPRIALQVSLLVTICLILVWRYYAPDLPSNPLSSIKHDRPEQDWSQPISSTATTTSPGSLLAETTSTSIQITATNEAPTTSSVQETIPTTTTETEVTQATEPVESESPSRIQNAPEYVKAIMNPDDTHFPRLSCPAPTHDRYEYLKSPANDPEHTDRPKRRYFFALDLHECAHLLPRLLGSIVETIRFLGPEHCALSIVEGRSEDGTFEILNTLRKETADMGTAYFFTTSTVNPTGEGVDRISALAGLRNQALLPLTRTPETFSPDTSIIFVNDVSLCMEDILELMHQRQHQNASMTCAMDWIFSGWSFYDVWISRTMKGDQFFEIPQSGSWDYADKLFWNDPETLKRQNAGKPYQVFSCWNGATVFTAKPIMEGQISFRANYDGECYLGEPTHFCKDMWWHGYGRIAVIPSVNFGYDDAESRKIKAAHGSVASWIARAGDEDSAADVPKEMIEWDDEPPETIKCVPSYQNPSWVRWDQALNETRTTTTTTTAAEGS